MTLRGSPTNLVVRQSGDWFLAVASSVAAGAQGGLGLFSDVAAGCFVAVDARLDNRTSLIRELAPNESQEVSDARLVAEAYQRWGVECPRHLRGDFAFVLWDERRRRVLAARDIFGVRGLAYSSSRGRLAVASSIQAILAAFDAQRPQLNQAHLRNYIAGNLPHQPTATALDGIHRLAPGHRLLYSDGVLTIDPYDQLRKRSITIRSQAEADEAFLETFTAAVETRLRPFKQVGFLVSGGMDSSALLAIANDLVERGRIATRLRAYSAVFERYPQADERSYLLPLYDGCPHVVASHVPCDDRTWTVDRLGPADGFPMDEPPQANRAFLPSLAATAREDGCEAVFQGTWADQLLLRHAYYFGELLWQLPWQRMRTDVRGFWRKSGTRLLTSIPSALARRVLPAPFQPWPAYERLLRRSFVHGGHANAITQTDRLARFTGIEYDYPFLDRDLHELILAMPVQFLFSGVFGKQPLRRYVSARISRSFEERRQYGDLFQFVADGMNQDKARITALFKDSQVVKHDLIAPWKITRLLRQLESGVSIPTFADLHRLSGVELWLRARTSNGP
jgi:asparagine synthetase B (glutamine-hydrolysing)